MTTKLIKNAPQLAWKDMKCYQFKLLSSQNFFFTLCYLKIT